MIKRIISVLVLLTCASVVFASGNFRYSLLQSFMYDSNIYETAKDLKSSGISSTQLFLDYLSKIPNSSLNLGISANTGYNAFTEDSAKNNYWNAGLNLALSNEYFKLKNRFVYTSEQANNSLSERSERIGNEFVFNARTSNKRMFAAGIIVSDEYNRYIKEEDKALNRNRVNGGLQFFYNISPKTSIFVEDIISSIVYENNDINNSLENSVSLGIEGNITPKVKGDIKFSYDNRQYEKIGIDNASIFGYEVKLFYEPNNVTSITVLGDRKIEETIYGQNRYYISTGGNLLLNRQITQRFDAEILFSYENMYYPYGAEKREDNFYRVSPSLNYQFMDRWFASLWYQFKNRKSNVVGMEYTDNVFGLNIKFTF